MHPRTHALVTSHAGVHPRTRASTHPCTRTYPHTCTLITSHVCAPRVSAHAPVRSHSVARLLVHSHPHAHTPSPTLAPSHWRSRAPASSRWMACGLREFSAFTSMLSSLCVCPSHTSNSLISAPETCVTSGSVCSPSSRWACRWPSTVYAGTGPPSGDRAGCAPQTVTANKGRPGTAPPAALRPGLFQKRWPRRSHVHLDECETHTPTAATAPPELCGAVDPKACP